MITQMFFGHKLDNAMLPRVQQLIFLPCNIDHAQEDLFQIIPKRNIEFHCKAILARGLVFTEVEQCVIKFCVSKRPLQSESIIRLNFSRNILE